MSWLRRFLFRLQPFFNKKKIEAELSDEIRIHIEMLTEVNLKQGMSVKEARHLALRQFGGVDQIKEAYRRQRGFAGIERWVQNLRGAIRQLRKDPVLTSAVIATLALGIGANTAIYTVIYATMLAPLPLPNPGQMVMVWSKIDGARNSMSSADYLDWRRQSRSFQRMTAFAGIEFNFSLQGEPEDIEGRLCTPGFYNMLGLHFMLGRDFLPEEETPGKDRVVILSYNLWNRLGANRNIVGERIQLNRSSYEVVGVLSPSPADRYVAPLTVPLAFKPEEINYDYHWMATMARLKPGLTLGQAQAEMDVIAARIAAAHPASSKGWGVVVEPLKGDFVEADRRHSLWLLLGAVGLVLLIACGNIANLLLAKGAARQREIAVRGALGASRRAIFTQFLVESSVLALVGGILGLGLGVTLLRILVAAMPAGTLPNAEDLHLDLPVLSVELAATMIAGLLFGSAPAWYASRIDPGKSLKGDAQSAVGPAGHKLRRLLVVGEFALALALMAAAGLTIHSFANLMRIDLGIRTDHVLTFRLQPPADRFKEAPQINAYYRQILSSIRSIAGVSEVAVDTGVPLRHTSDGMPFTIVGQPAYADSSKRPGAGFQSISPGYFKTFGIPVLKGRAFNDRDTATSVHVAMVNEEFVERYLPNLDPFKTRLSVEEIIPGLPKLGPPIAWQIVGIFHNVRYQMNQGLIPEINVPFTQSLSPNVTIASGGANAAINRRFENRDAGVRVNETGGDHGI